MALGPVGALLVAHASTVRNRLRREVSRNGAALAAAALVMFLATSVGPLLIGVALGGYFLGRQLPSPLAATLIGGMGTVLAVFGGSVGGTLGGTRQLSWESYRTFPLARRHLLAAELVAGLGDMVPFLIATALVVLNGGVAVARPRLAPLAALLAVEGTVFVLAVQLLIGGLAAALVRRVQTAVGSLVVLGALGGLLTRHVGRRDLRELGAALLRVLDVLPLGFAAAGLREAAEGRWAPALARHAYPLATLVALVAVVGWMLGRDLDRDSPQASGPATGRRWRFGSPAGGVAELYLRQLLDSSMGRAGLVMPLLTVFLVRGPLAALVGQAAWLVPASYAYTAVAAMNVQTSFFGLDGHGIKALLTLPLRADELLAGKIRALGVYQALQMALLTALLAIVQRPPARELAAGVLMSAAAFGLLVTVGQFLSCWMPRPVSRQAMQKAGAPLPLAMVSLLSWGLISAALSSLQTLLVTRAPGALVPVMALAAALSLALLRATRGPAARYLDASRERIADRIGG